MNLRKHSRTISVFARILPVFLVFLGCFAAAQTAQAGFLDEVKLLPGRFVEGAAIVKNEIVPAAPASIAGVWQNIICFFGFCETEKELPNANLQSPVNEQKGNGQLSLINDNFDNSSNDSQEFSEGLTLWEDQRVRPSENSTLGGSEG